MWPERPNKKSMLLETPAERRTVLWELNVVFTVLQSEARVGLASGIKERGKIILIITFYY